jgi:PDZ domain-containing secreted protein
LLPGDLIKAIDGSKLGSDQDLAPTLAHKDPGQEVTIQIERAGRTLDVKMVLGRRR